jgi:hypothetical protein
MLDTLNTNLEIYEDAINILEDIQNNDVGWQIKERGPAIAATILYQLLDAKQRRENK